MEPPAFQRANEHPEIADFARCGRHLERPVFQGPARRCDRIPSGRPGAGWEGPAFDGAAGHPAVYGREVSGPQPNPATLAEVFRAALRLGLTSFGGPIAHIGYFRREYVERRRWFDDRAFAELLALCQPLPGPASSQLGIAIGARRAGLLGGIVSWLGFTIPSAVVLVVFGLASGSADLSNASWLHGLKLAAVAVVAQAVYLLARSLAPDWPRRALAVAGMAVALLWATPFSQLAIIVGGALVGWLVLRTHGVTRASGAATDNASSPIGQRAGAVAPGMGQ